MSDAHDGGQYSTPYRGGPAGPFDRDVHAPHGPEQQRPRGQHARGQDDRGQGDPRYVPPAQYDQAYPDARPAASPTQPPSQAAGAPQAPPPRQPDQRSGASNGRQSLVRPYAMTGGRTRPRYQLAIEALVSTTGQASQATNLLPEHQRIVSLCQQVKSVAEISALLGMPLGVARILVADLAEAGLVAIHQPGNAEAGQPDVTLLERVLSGLRKL